MNLFADIRSLVLDQLASLQAAGSLPDGLDTVRLTTWDHGAGQWTPISDPFDVTG